MGSLQKVPIVVEHIPVSCCFWAYISAAPLPVGALLTFEVILAFLLVILASDMNHFRLLQKVVEDGCSARHVADVDVC